MSDIQRAIKKRKRIARAVARRLWVDRLAFHVDISWPPGFLGALCGVVLMLTPPIVLALVAVIATRRRRRA